MSAPNKTFDPVEVEALKPGSVERARDEALAAIAAAADLAALHEAKIAHAGDRSPLALANREIGALPPAAKAEAGKRVGQARAAVTTALAVSGLPTDRFCFEGFPPRKGGERARRFAELAADPRTHVLFESPRRVAATLEELRGSHGDDRSAVVCRELTKTHEEIVRGSLAELAAWAADQEASGGVRGEITLVVAGVGQAAVRAAARVAAREARRAERHRGG